MSALETLEKARAARAAGDVGTCLVLSSAALFEAEEEGDAQTAYLAAVCPGRMYMGRGEPSEALGHFRNALDVALQHGLTRKLANAYHNLFSASVESANTDAAKRFFAVSFEVYRDIDPRDPRLTALFADAAEGKLMQTPSQDTAADAMQGWRACTACMNDPQSRLYASANIIVASAVLGIRSRYADALSTLEDAFALLPDHEGAAMAIAHASLGVSRMRDHQRAASLAERALGIAVERGEGVAEDRAREALDAALAERAARV